MEDNQKTFLSVAWLKIVPGLLHSTGEGFLHTVVRQLGFDHRPLSLSQKVEEALSKSLFLALHPPQRAEQPQAARPWSVSDTRRADAQS